MRSWAVLGGGALGLTAALRLVQRGHRVTVIEREPLPGGLAAGFEIEPGVWLEKFYHHLFRSDTTAVRLIREMGLGDRLEWHRPITATLRDGVFHQLDSPSSLLKFTALPVVDRLRMGAALAALKAMPNPRLLEGQTAEGWIRRWMGDEAYRVVWGPLLSGKFGATAGEIAMPWFWARVHDRSAQLGYLRGGFQQLYEALAQRIRDGGGEMRLGTAVESVKRDGDALIVQTDGGTGQFDAVISTLATRLTCRLTDGLPTAYRDRYEWGRAYGAQCVILALDRPLTSAYWTNMNDPGYPFMALVEHTNYMPAADYGGRYLVYLGNYRPMDDPLLQASGEELLDQFLPHLERVNPAFDRSWMSDAWLFRAPFAQPIVTVDYRMHIPPFETPIPGLYVANMFQVYPHDRGQNYSIALAERLVNQIAG
ncbi:MAG: NAD(P)/FAD-dependent oxidoreductase [Chloroflexota bacterium]|nr:NAD(P)/FAD-dependent oxidoreductase [Chloroflexota bacterium]